MGIDLDGSITRGKVLIIPGVVFLDATRELHTWYYTATHPCDQTDRWASSNSIPGYKWTCTKAEK